MPGFQLLHHDLLDYTTAWTMQVKRVEQILAGEAGNLFWVLEHPPVYTLGQFGKCDDILMDHIPVVLTDRGGKATYHGPGQLVGYVIRDLRPNRYAVRDHVDKLEATVIRALAMCKVEAVREAGNPGVWVDGAKIGALGVRIRRGVAYHGFAINRSVDLAAFRGIIPCGLSHRPVTSLAQLGIDITRADLTEKLVTAFRDIFSAEWILE